MTPWQARLSLLTFLLIAGAVVANLMLQHGRPGGAPIRAVGEAAFPQRPVERPSAILAVKRDIKAPPARLQPLSTASTKAHRAAPAHPAKKTPGG